MARRIPVLVPASSAAGNTGQTRTEPARSVEIEPLGNEYIIKPSGNGNSNGNSYGYGKIEENSFDDADFQIMPLPDEARNGH